MNSFARRLLSSLRSQLSARLSAPLPAQWRAFVQKAESSQSFFRFTAIFFAIWGAYDLLDLGLGGTAANYWLVNGARQAIRELRILQGLLVAAQFSIVWIAARNLRSRGLLFGLLCVVFVLRSIEAYFYFGLNDFYYYAVTVFLLLQFFALGGETELARWPRTFLRYQTAWIYFATAFLKLNPYWLSGDHLWVRQEYLLRILHWPVTMPLQNLLSRLPVEHWLALAGVTGEATLAFLLLARAPRWCVIGLAVLMHGFAALALNVWFFGASMIAQVVFVSGGTPSEHSAQRI